MKPISDEFHIIFANYFSTQPIFFDGDLKKKPYDRMCVELSFQLTKARQWNEVTDILCNLDFIQPKAVAKVTYNLIKDFNGALLDLPDETWEGQGCWAIALNVGLN